MPKSDIFLRLDVSSIIDGYQKKRFTPTEIAAACIQRMQDLNPAYKAMVVFDPERILKQAMDVEKRLDTGALARPLEGIPVGVKDIFNTLDLPTQMGSPLWRGFTPGNDARVVHQVKQRGGIVAGKTETAEFAVHTLGDAINPHDGTRTPGTSSSGSAVGIATAMFPVALGTQTAGSIVRPASFCGIYGCKPSFGLIPRTGTLKTTDSLDTIGFFVLHAADLRKVFDVLRVHGPDYPISHRALNDASRQHKQAGRPWRILLARTHTWQHAPDYAKKALLAFAEVLEATGSVVVEDPEFPSAVATSHEVHATIYNKSLAYYFAGEFKRAELVSEIMNDLILRGRAITARQFHAALKEQERLEHIVDEFLQRYDVLISLSTAGEAPLRNDIEKPDSALVWTLAHLPVISAPAFVSPAGLPFGLQIASRRYHDYLLLAFTDFLLQTAMIPATSNPTPRV